MILSMTGYGKAVATYGTKKIYAEVNSLNSEAIDLSTRIAPLYREKEMEIRTLVAQQLERICILPTVISLIELKSLESLVGTFTFFLLTTPTLSSRIE